MQIIKIQGNNNYQTKYNSVNFGAWHKTVYKTESGGKTLDNIRRTTATWMFRENPNWKQLTAFLAEKYQNIPKVNVYDYACSNGSEAYTFLIAMFNDLGHKTSKKFLPVIAKDCDGGAIYRAQQPTIELNMDEISDIERYTNGNFDKYFYSKYHDNKYTIRRWNLSPNLTSNVQFSVADILEDYKNIAPNNSVIFVRNFWPYLSLEERNMLVKGLYSQLGENSTLIIGAFDRHDPIYNKPIDTDLINAGFKPSKVDYVYEK